MKILLINPNRIKPIIAPIGLEYLTEFLLENNVDVSLLDLNLYSYPKEALMNKINEINNNETQKLKPDLIGITLRNTDDCFFAGKGSFLEEINEYVQLIKMKTEIPIVIGGVGFSTAAIGLMKFFVPNFGIHGDGEKSCYNLLSYLTTGKPKLNEIGGLLYWNNAELIENGLKFDNINSITMPYQRNILHNFHYLRNGGQLGIETKRGCTQNCIYCADPIAKGRTIRLKDPKNVVLEIKNLVNDGLNIFHTCDCEFNVPIKHAKSICKELINENLGDKIEWYAYCFPDPKFFDEELAELMNNSGCKGINFGVDSADSEQIKRLGRNYNFQDLKNLAILCKKHNFRLMYDLLLGGPGETWNSIEYTINSLKSIPVDKIGVSFGVRVYPGTYLAESILKQGSLKNNPNLHGNCGNNVDFIYPLYYIESSLGNHLEIETQISELIGNDKRFLFATSENTSQNYNYNENKVLTDSIANGKRGAFWSILMDIENENIK